jgi:hypothetical protein
MAAGQHPQSQQLALPVPAARGQVDPAVAVAKLGYISVNSTCYAVDKQKHGFLQAEGL